MIKLDVAHTNFIKKLESQGKSSATVVAYKKDVEQLIDHLIKEGVNLVTEIELGHLESFMNELAEAEYTAKSISRKTNATRTFIKHLNDEGLITGNIGLGLKHPKLEQKAPRILTKLEYRALRDAARNDSRSYAMIEVLLQTGVTISELADIKTKNIEMGNEKGSMHVPAKNSRDSRSIPLNKAVIEAITRYINDREDKDAEHLFITKTGNPLLVRNIRSTIDRFFKLAGVEKAKVNDLRHTFVAKHLEMGISIIQISKIAGHKRISTTEKYLEFIERPISQEKTELGIL